VDAVDINRCLRHSVKSSELHAQMTQLEIYHLRSKHERGCEPGRGSTFTIRLVDAPKEAVAANLAHTEPTLKHHYQILLHCMNPEVAQSGHARRVGRCPLSGVKRTSNAQIEFFRF